MFTYQNYNDVSCIYHYRLNMRIIKPLNIRNIIKEEIELLDETYDSIKEISTLSNEIIKEVSGQNLETINKYRELRHIYGLSISQLSGNPKFKDLKGLINRLNLYILFEPKEGTVRGNYSVYKYKDKRSFNLRHEREITVYYDFDELYEKIQMLFSNKDKITHNELYYAMFSEFNDTLIHELQHAYDDYRSRGMAYKTKEHSKYQKKYESEINDKLQDVAFKKFEKYKDYLNLPHEIWARFTQTINDIHLAGLDFKEDENGKTSFHEYMHPFNEVLSKFKNSFVGYEHLNDDMKKRLIRKLSQFWHIENDILRSKKNG